MAEASEHSLILMRLILTPQGGHMAGVLQRRRRPLSHAQASCPLIAPIQSILNTCMLNHV
jgi:hypothetical protein